MTCRTWLFAAWMLMSLPHTVWASIDVNRADVNTLQSIKGVGPGMTVRILNERRKRTFKDWPDFIGRVQGVGQANAARLSHAGLTVNGKSLSDGPSQAAPAAATSQKTAAPGQGAKAEAARRGEARHRKPSRRHAADGTDDGDGADR